MQKVTSFEQACEITGAEPNIQFPEYLSAATIAAHKLEIIYKATVGDWKADFSDHNQDKWTPWLSWVPSASAFVFTGTDFASTGTRLGARFWFPNPSTARYFTEQHIELINQLHS